MLGRYTILGKLTQGGMAEVYLAQQKGPAGYTKLVVVKRVRPNLANDKDFVAMFVNEARLAALINHPNVVQIFDLGQDKKDWFLAMEFLDGRDMLQIGRACRAHNKAVPFDVTARIIADACAGLEHAHRLVGADGKSLNLVHRDMSPENLLITFEGQVKVLDFGIAKARDNAFRTQAGQIKGKLGYVAPEAILGKELDGRADIFAIGATLYLFLCGRPAFTGSNPMEIFEKSLQPPQAPSSINPRVPPMLEEICVRCLAQDPSKRYGGAGELRAALEAYLGSTKRPLGAAQLSQFMQILFPPDEDPVRQKIEELMAHSDAAGFELGATNLSPAANPDTMQASGGESSSYDYMSDDEDSTAVVPPEERPDGLPAATAPPPAAVPPPDATARGAPAFRSVELASSMDPAPQPEPSAEATVNRQPYASRSDLPPSEEPAREDMTVELSADLLSELRASASQSGGQPTAPKASAAPKPVSGEGITDNMDEPTLGLDDLHVDASAERSGPTRTELARDEPPPPLSDGAFNDDDDDFEIEDSLESAVGPPTAPPPAPASTGDHVQFDLRPVSEEAGEPTVTGIDQEPSFEQPTHEPSFPEHTDEPSFDPDPGDPTFPGDGPIAASAEDIGLAPLEETDPSAAAGAPGVDVPPAPSAAPTAEMLSLGASEGRREVRWVPPSMGKRIGMFVAGMVVGTILLGAALWLSGDLELVQQRLGSGEVVQR